MRATLARVGILNKPVTKDKPRGIAVQPTPASCYDVRCNFTESAREG